MHKQIKITSAFKIKEAIPGEADSLIIEGYANTTTKDRVGDVVLEEAWTKGGLGAYMKNPIILAFHNHSKPVGKTISYEVSEKGLYIAAEISKSAADVYNLVKEGILKTFSIGFMVKDADYDSTTNIFVIKDLELLEVSIVSVPANSDSIFSVRKSLEDSEYEDLKKEFKHSIEEPKKEENAEDIKEVIISTVSDMLSSFEKNMEEISKTTIAAATKATVIEPKQKEKTMTVEVTDTGVEKLLSEVEKRFADRMDALESAGINESESLTKTIEDLKGELADKATEIESLQKSKMRFDEKATLATISSAERDEAVLLAKLIGKSISDTKLGRNIIEKAPVSDHLGATMNDAWEEEFSTRIFADIRERLIIEPMFTNINMNTPTMHIPINPEAGYGEWIDSTLYKDAATSTGAAKTHSLTDRTLIAYKLAAKEYIGYEEEEDSIIPILPIVRDAIIRRMAKSSDKALLIGTGVGTTSPSTSDPITGLAALATAGSKELAAADQPSLGASDKVTAATLQAARRLLGVWGHAPADVVYIVSHDAYFDLLEDPDFRTVDMVGAKATILTGQVGAINGSPVVVSGEYEAQATGKVFVTALNKSNFIKGQLRGVTVERDRDIEFQRNVLVATRRVGMLQVIDTEGVATGAWKA